uniref:SET domain-containing protein n=1 Tax=Macrostomum lignano TaxID=282301 RepID=A0A1I8JPE6_9PLAT
SAVEASATLIRPESRTKAAEVSDIVRGGQLVHPLGVAEVFVPRLVEVRHAERLCLYSVQLFQWSWAADGASLVDMRNRYHAGCGKGWTGCKTCKTSLCNIPDSQRALAEPSSGVDFAALSQGQPAAVGRLTLANATAASDSKDEKKKGARPKLPISLTTTTMAAGDFRPNSSCRGGHGPAVPGGLIKCKSSTECFESWANSDSSSDSSIVRSGGIGDPHPAGVPDEGAEVSDIVRGGQLVHPLGVAEVFVPRLVEVRAEGDVMLRGLLSYATEGTETFLFRLGMAERLCLYSVQLFQSTHQAATACVKWSFDSECKTCNTPLCNFQLAKKISAEQPALLLWPTMKLISEKRGSGAPKMLETCYHLEYKNKYN